MYMFVCQLRNGEVLMARPVNNEEEVNVCVDQIVRAYGADYLGDNGVRFDVMLAA